MAVPIPSESGHGASSGELSLIMGDEQLITPHVLPSTFQAETKLSGATTAKHLIESAVVGFEVTPANEVARAAIFAVSQRMSDSPVVGAAAYGGATLLIEGAAAIAAADLLSTGRGQKVIGWTRDRLKKILPQDAEKVPLPLEIAIGAVGGSAVSVIAQDAVRPGMTSEERRRYGMRNALRLTGLCALQGAAMSKGIQSPNVATIGAAVGVVGGSVWGAKRVISRFRGSEKSVDTPEAEKPLLVDYNMRSGTTYQMVRPDGSTARDGLELERTVWRKKQYGDSVTDYAEYVPQSRVFVATKEIQDDTSGTVNDATVAVVRVFGGSPLKPPFMEFDFDDDLQKQRLLRECEDGTIEELATSGADDERASVATDILALWRLAYRDAKERGVKNWGIIMEPRRVMVMNRRYGFTFKQAGPTKYYQGGDCAPHVMNFEEVERNMGQHMPERLEWFINEPFVTPDGDNGRA